MKWTGLMLMAALVAAQAATPAKKTEGDPGEELFKSKCALCHGKDGKGSEKTAKLLNTELKAMNLTLDEHQKKSDAELTKVINEGQKKMKGFKGKLKDEEITSVLGYVRSLAPKEAKAEKGAAVSAPAATK